VLAQTRKAIDMFTVTVSTCDYWPIDNTFSLFGLELLELVGWEARSSLDRISPRTDGHWGTALAYEYDHDGGTGSGEASNGLRNSKQRRCKSMPIAESARRTNSDRA